MYVSSLKTSAWCSGKVCVLQGSGDQNSIKFPNEVGETIGISQKKQLASPSRPEINQENLNILKKAYIPENIITGREKFCFLLKKYLIV